MSQRSSGNVADHPFRTTPSNSRQSLASIFNALGVPPGTSIAPISTARGGLCVKRFDSSARSRVHRN